MRRGPRTPPLGRRLGDPVGVEYPVQLRTVMAAIVQLHGSARGLSATEVEVLADHAGAIVDAIADAWPVDTSTSRDAWTDILHTTAGNIGFDLVNDVYYVEFVHRAGEPAIPPLWETLLPETIQAMAPAMNADLIAAVAETERRYRLYRAQGMTDSKALNKALAERGSYRSRLAA